MSINAQMAWEMNHGSLGKSSCHGGMRIPRIPGERERGTDCVCLQPQNFGVIDRTTIGALGLPESLKRLISQCLRGVAKYSSPQKPQEASPDVFSALKSQQLGFQGNSMCKGPGGEAQGSEGACCCRKWVGACQGILERPAATCSKERHVLVRSTQKSALWVTVSWVFSVLHLSQAIHGRESPAAIDQEGLNCNGGQ